jgi:hypothetical protein
MFKLNKYHVFLYLPHGFVAVSYILPFYTTIARSITGSAGVQLCCEFLEGTPLYIPPLTYIVNKKIIKNPNEFSG